MTGFAFPEMLVDVVRLCNEGAQDEASDLFDAYLPLIRPDLNNNLVRGWLFAKRYYTAEELLSAIQ